MMGPVRRALLGAAVIAALAASDAPPDAFGLGVLRRDGVIVPFASYDGRRWRNTWPSPSADLTVPINLSSVPKRWWGPTGPLETWQAWIVGTARAIRVTQPDWVKVHCSHHLALKTDYEPGTVLPLEVEQPYPKDGLAVSPPRSIGAVEIIEPEDLAARPVTSMLREAFNRAERQTANRGYHPVQARAREGIEPTIEALYAFGDSPRFYYLEATRPYRLREQFADDCSALAYGTGWFIREGDQVRSLLMYVDLLPCNRDGASYMLPLGVVRAQDRLFWVAQFSGWDHERYTVIELKPKAVEVVLNTWGGGC